MKLLNNLYMISKRETTSLSAQYGIFLEVKSFIYKAHFPNEPIIPECYIASDHTLRYICLGQDCY